ncbi:hypothetical protein FRX31_025234 [Thalictrum thalictroides]|uniref:Uncharacterized protein n=1 Tax=Thalictrum thalictroides TaxID=46969 RepID=A0A7J6VJ83_THATH|nr:hypothetical protein FRX31_025234 [Thalictrum thalictroides]
MRRVIKHILIALKIQRLFGLQGKKGAFPDYLGSLPKGASLHVIEVAENVLLLINNAGTNHCPRTKSRGRLLQLGKAMPTYIQRGNWRLNETEYTPIFDGARRPGAPNRALTNIFVYCWRPGI